MKNKTADQLAKFALLLCTGAAIDEALSAIERPCQAAPAVKIKSTLPQRQQTLSSAQLQSYLIKLRGQLLHVWEPADGKNIVILTGTVKPTGQVDDVKTTNSKASDLAIQAATMAFEKVQPLQPLPTGVTSDCKLSITFSSSVDPHGDSTANVMTRFDPLPQLTSTQATKSTTDDNIQTGSNK